MIARISPAFLSTVLFLLALPLPDLPWMGGALNAQEISGRVVDQASLDPIRGAIVSVVDADGTNLGSRLTDGDGRFRIGLEQAGEAVSLQAESIFHRRTVVDSLSVEEDETLDVGDVALEAVPFALDSIVVQGERSRLTRGQEWVRQHQLLGEGTFLPGAAIAADRPRSLAGYVANRTGLWSSFGIRGDGYLYQPPGGLCDGVFVLVNRWPLERTGFESVDDIPHDQIAAIEVYEDYRELPPIYSFEGSGGRACGVVSIWLWNSW